jgi:hypothetical protein
MPAFAPLLSSLFELVPDVPAGLLELVAGVAAEDEPPLAGTLVGALVPTCSPLAPPPSMNAVTVVAGSLPELVTPTTNVVWMTILFELDTTIGFVVELSLGGGGGLGVVDVSTGVEVTTTVDSTVVVLFASLNRVDVIVENCVDIESTSDTTVLVSRMALLYVSHTNSKS